MPADEGLSGTLRLRAMGGLRVERDGQSVQDLPRKAAALLLYLTDTGQPATRSTLAGLLWSNVEEERARSSLRIVLTRLRSALPGVVETDRDQVALAQPLAYDVTDTDAVDLAPLADGFLSGVELPGASLLNERGGGTPREHPRPDRRQAGGRRRTGEP